MRDRLGDTLGAPVDLTSPEILGPAIREAALAEAVPL